MYRKKYRQIEYQTGEKHIDPSSATARLESAVAVANAINDRTLQPLCALRRLEQREKSPIQTVRETPSYPREKHLHFG